MNNDNLNNNNVDINETVQENKTYKYVYGVSFKKALQLPSQALIC